MNYKSIVHLSYGILTIICYIDIIIFILPITKIYFINTTIQIMLILLQNIL